MLSLLLFFSFATAHANVHDIFAELLGRPQPDRINASYEIQQYQSRPTKAVPHKIALRQHTLDASLPLTRTSDNKWKVLFNAGLDEVRTNAQFANNRLLPNRLWQVGAGLSHLRMLEGDKIAGGSFLVGSNGDKPFSAFRDTSFQGNLVYKLPREKEAAWIFFLNISNTRSFLNYWPLPGAAYFFRAHAKLRMAVGVPFFSLFWNPFEGSVLSFSYFPVYSAQVKWSYFLFGQAQFYAQAKYHSKNHFLSQRTDKRERLFYEEALAEGGFSMPLEHNIHLDANLGLSFDRKFFLGRSTRKKTAQQLIQPEKAPYASVKLVATF